MINKLVHSIQDLYRIVNDQAPERIIKELEIERLAVKEYLRQHDPYETVYCSIKRGGCLSNGLLAWEKDKNHKYTMVNNSLLHDLHGLSPADKIVVLGKTDAELINAWRAETGEENTFGELCVSTDAYVQTALKTCRFFEFGYRLGKPLLLDVFKSPIIANDQFIGTRGNALNISARESDAVDLLKFYISNGSAERLDAGGSAVAAYLVRDRKKQFNREFPG